jgi:ribosome maturation factor RimP
LPTFCVSGDVFTPSAERLDRVREAAERVARSYGLEVFDVQLRRESVGTVLRVIIDRPDPGKPSNPDEDAVGIADCQRVSQDLSALLDVEEDELRAAALGQAYTLEVSSPGLDRPLRHEADYRRFEGRLAKLVTSRPVNGQSAFAGRLAGLDHGAVLLEEGRKVHRVPLADIKRGRLEVEF